MRMQNADVTLYILSEPDTAKLNDKHCFLLNTMRDDFVKITAIKRIRKLLKL